MRFLSKRPPKDIAAAFFFLCVVALLVCSAIWAYRQYRYSPPYVDEEKYPVRGIDVSRHNGIIDFQKVGNDGIDFVFVKASEGVSLRDSMYRRNIKEADKHGLKTGAYHFFRFDCEGVPQAVNFLEAVGSDKLDLGLVIDVEATGNPSDIPKEVVKNRLESMVEFLNLSGHRIMFYTNLDGYYDYIQESFPGYPLWICRFQQNPINAEWTFWQYNHHGKVEGVDGDVDLNAFSGSRDEWKEYVERFSYPLQSPLLN